MLPAEPTTTVVPVTVKALEWTRFGGVNVKSVRAWITVSFQFLFTVFLPPVLPGFNKGLWIIRILSHNFKVYQQINIEEFPGIISVPALHTARIFHVFACCKKIKKFCYTPRASHLSDLGE